LAVIKNISPVEVCRLNEESGGVILIDVGTESEFGKGRAAIAQNIPLQALSAAALDARGIHASDPVFVISMNRDQARKACELLLDYGYEHVHLVEGGTRAWVRLGLANCRKTGRGS
jgi:rhodanese-related sulfurtransferase